MAKSTKIAPPESLQIRMKVGILHTIAKSIYSGVYGKIREAVSNSIDNDATWFTIFVDRSTRTISLLDNGSGITKERFREIFKSLGYGLLRDFSHLSYFGLGLMSIIQLGKRAKIYTRTSGRDEVLCLSIEADKIFDPANEKQPIEFLKGCLNLTATNMAIRAANSPLMDEHIKGLFAMFPESFTEIVIEDIKPDDFEFITSRDFETEMRKILPLAPEKGDPFLARIKDVRAKKWIREIISNPKYCRTIDVFFGIAGEKEFTQLWKYFPDFKRWLEFGETNIMYGEGEENNFAYYILFAIEDLEDRQKENAETGFWIRNRNFLVKPADYFQQPGSRKKYIQEPLKNWIYGEIFHQNMNEFLVVSRNDYVWDSPKFETFKNEVVGLVTHLNKELRSAWKYGDEIVKSVIAPFQEISEKSGPFHRANETISVLGIPCDGEDAIKVLEDLKKKRRPELEVLTDRIDSLLKKGSGQITLADDENSLVVIDQSVGEEVVFTKTLDPDLKRVVISISPSLFSPRRIVFLGKTFEVYFVARKESDAGISFDVDGGKIFVNPFNQDLINYTVSFLDIYIALDIADVMASTKEEMKHYFLKLLGTKYENPSEYLSPLADDLQRKKRSR